MISFNASQIQDTNITLKPAHEKKNQKKWYSDICVQERKFKMGNKNLLLCEQNLYSCTNVQLL